MVGTITITVGQREAANVILKEESTENMEINPPELNDKSNDDEQKDIEDANKQLPSEEKEEQPSESPSNDVGFKKVFKLVGFKFTVKKDKTEKMEPVQLLNVKAEVTEGSYDGAGDYKEFKTETEEEATQSEILDFVEKTEEETQTEEMKEKTSEKVAESPVEAESKEAEIKTNGNKSPESPVSPLTSETASPLRKFFTQGWAGFRKRTSFRKPKEEEPQTEKEKQEQKSEKEMTIEGIVTKEELEKEKLSPEKDRTEVSLEASDVKMESEKEREEETKMIEVSTETNLKEAATPGEQPSTEEVAENINKEVDISLKGKTDLELEEKLEPVQESLIGLEQSTVALSEEKTELGAPLLNEVFEEKINQSDSLSPVTVEKPEEPFEIIEEKSEPKAPLATEIFDEKPTEVVTKEEPKTTKKEQLVLEQLVKTKDDFQKEQPTVDTVEQLKIIETVPEIVKEHFRQTDPNNLDAATHKAPEGITSEVELLSSQEKAKMQGSPLKKLFTGTGLKKLSGKKHKGKKEEAKLGEAAEQIQQLSDSAESPDDPRAESSASSPEEMMESVEKASEAAQIPEGEEGSPSDAEKKRESVTPWASFKKMVTPKKRVRRLSESDREEELDKTKSATLSSTESAPNDEQDDIKENDEEQKIEKSADEPKRKVDTSVSWEALICVGSSKKRTRKSSSSDEEVGQRLAQDGQKLDEGAPNKEAVHDIIFTNSQESDQGQGNSSPEQAGSPSETEGVSTWESFKRLVTPRRKSKTKMEEKNDEPTTVPSLEHATLDGDAGKEESWVSFKKLMPGRRKKKSDGIPEHVPVQEAGEEITGTNEEDSDVPAVVPLSEYEAAEQEKFVAQKTEQEDKKTSSQNIEKSESTLIIEQASEGLVHAVAVSVVEGERAVTSIEERSPSWISAAVTESIEHVNEDEKKSEQISGTGIVEETVVVTKLIPHMRKNISGDTIVSELELTSEAVTAREEASGVEETTEISCAEETTEMVSAVSRLTESPDTTEIATPVQEIEESEQDLEELNKQTQERLQVVAERIKLSDGKGISEDLTEVTVQPLSAEKIGHEISAISKEVELPLNEVVQINEVTESCETQIKVKEDGLKEVLKKSNEMLVEGKEESELITSLELVESHHPKTEQESVKQYEDIIGEQTVEEKSDEGFVIVTVTPDEQPEIEVSDTFEKQQMLLKEMDSEEYKSTDTMQEIIMNLEETTQNKVTESVPEMDELEQVTCDEKSQVHQKQEEIQNNLYDLESQPSEIILVEVNEAVAQNEVRDFGLLTESPQTEVFVPEAAIQSQLTEVPPSTVKDVAFGTETGSTEEAAVEACVQSKDSCTSLKNEAHIQKVGPEVQLQKFESRISQTDVKTEPFLLYEETQILAETMEKEMSPQVMEMDVHKLNAKAEAQVINDHVEELEIKSQVQSGEAEVLAEKAELKVDMELSTEKAKTESPTEKVIIEDHLKEEEAQLSAEKAHTKLEREVCQGKIDVEVDVEKIEKVEVRVPEEMVNGTVFVETSTEQIDAKLESGVPVEKADTKVDEEASKKKTDADVEADVPAGKTIIEPLQDQADAKLNGEIFAMKGDIKSYAENMDAEIAKNESDILNCLPADRKHLTEGAAAESTVEKTVTELFTEEVVASMEKVDTKAGVEVFTEKVDEKANADVPAEQRAAQIPTEQSDGMMVTEAIGRELELKETLQNVMNEVRIQSEVEDSGDSLSKICDAVVSNEPSRREEKDASSTAEKPTEEAVLEKPSERDLLHISAPVQTAMDQIQKYVEDPNLTFPLQCTERISAKASGTEELKDVTLEESKCTEESGIEIRMQKKLLVLPSETEAIDTGVSEGLMQNEKEDTLIHLEPQYSKTKGAAETLENEEALNSVKNELGNGKLPAGRESAGKIVAEAVMSEEEGDLLISDSRFIESVVSNVILEKKRERELPEIKSEVQEADMSDTSVKTETHLEELPVETVRSPSESKAASEGCQGTLQLLEMVQIMELDKAVQKPELAAGGVLYAAPIQEPFTEQQEDAGTDIHDLQSYADYISSVTITAAAEERVIAEHVTLTETSTETLQTSLQEPKKPASKTIQFRSFAHSESGILYPDPDAVAFSEKIDSVIEESVLSAVRCTKEGLLQKCVFDSTSKMELPESSTNEESEQKVMTPERSPSTELPKDVQSVTIESQSSKIVQKIIQNAVDKLEQTEEAISSLKQESEACLVSGNESGIQEDVQVSQQISVAEEKTHEIQPTSVTAEKKEAIRVAKEMPLSSTESENGEKLSSRKTDADLETVKDIVNETERKNGDSKPQLEMDTAVSTETQKNMLGSIVSRDLPKGSLQIEQSTIMDLEVGLIVENQEKLIQHQTHRKRKEDYSQSTEFPEMHKEEDFTSCESPQLQAKLRES
ncbi:A-kinase anchor protein 12 isoform X1 [Python bivittatus]|uniref:A-kinase anchor protein 12 isoform X1 n=2 Tax=Python bivittatus TaxID=176946 RepID=A0A9F3QTQ0_PYTBI|nr:A-kinase anchor protein 12 isoform X1 [Python bivittatus]